MITNDLGIYIHIPFCVRKCPYCGFLSAPPESESQIGLYVDALVREIGMAGSAYGPGRQADTVFVGGGTPSVLEPGQIQKIFGALRDSFTITGDPEITIEANPGTLTKEKLKAFRDCGINRLSMGVQSLDDDILARLGRIHRKRDVFSCYEMARDAGFENINLDLMFGLAGQSRKIWEKTLDEVLALEPEHLSFYSLQIEEGTPFYDLYKAGRLDEASDEEERRMHHMAISAAEAAGLVHYEISNSARSGRQCRHNLKYWSMEEYLGLGLGAHSYLRRADLSEDACEEDKGADEFNRAEEKGAAEAAGYSDITGCRGIRYNNKEDMAGYLVSIESGTLPVDGKSAAADTERDAMGIYVFTALRKRSGVDLEDFRRRFGKGFFQAFPQAEAHVARWQEQGLAEIITDTGSSVPGPAETKEEKSRSSSPAETEEGGYFRLTEKGIDKSNDIMSEFV